ncbi:MAG: universal stress protein [Gammaproteobacteria bacterium]|nr:universal stress protein [Gammaproteobacteria bacterium]
MVAKKSVYKHVLLATDLSTHSDFLAKRAADIAKVTGAKLSMVHVIAHAAIAYAGEFTIPIDLEFENILKKQAATQLTKFGKKYDVPLKSLHIVEGSVKLAVTDLAKKIKADLIVVGTHSRKGFEILLGSQANAILHAASCDVWVIKTK